jgi:hypothetical protein
MIPKNASTGTGRAPGELLWISVAEPSSSVTTAARAASSQSSFRRNGDCTAGITSRALDPVIALYASLLIRSKIGMYIAMTIPPTTTPRKAIMTGSISVRSPATAASTSSS